MGFNSVYRCLQEVFPQIDTRILKAVAIENSKDADAAVNDILTEVLPFMATTSKNVEHGENNTLLEPRPAVEVTNAVPSERRSTFAGSLEESSHRNSSFDSDTTQMCKIYEAGSSSGSKIVDNSENGICSGGDFLANHMRLGAVVDADPSLGRSVENNGSLNDYFHDTDDVFNSDEAVNDSEVSGSHDVNDGVNTLEKSSVNEEVPVFLENICERENEHDSGKNTEKKRTDDLDHIVSEFESSISCDKVNDTVGDEQTSFVVNPSSMNGEHDNFPEPGSNAFDCSKANDFDLLLPERASKVDEVLFDHTQFVADLVLPSVQCHEADATECNLLSDLHGNTPATDYVEPRASGSFNLSSEKGSSVSETDCADDNLTKEDTFTQSGQICSTGFLDELIEDAKNNKKTLFSAMESVMNMMKEVELQERAVDMAKQEAAMGGLDILVKVEELKQLLAHAKEGNGMHAGEVYGEKAILATEVRELQSRLLCLSDERDKSLATLDEMRRTLEERLATAEEMKKQVEQEKLGKEESARKALSEQEAIMEKVVQESKLLEQEAAQNSKLREFLVDRGAIMDTLQGEISVICQDVSLLKEKFDNRVPLSLSVSSSQTTCKLASSGSSIKSVSSVFFSEERQSPKSPEKGSLDSSMGDLTPKICKEEEYCVSSIDKELLDDGWDIFEKDEELDS